MTAMMWNALIHSYMAADPRDQTFHVRDRCVRQDAVAEVEDERVSSERFKDGVDRTIERRAAGEQDYRIEIALNCAQRLNVIAGKIQLHHPIETHRVDRHGIQIALQLGSSATRKADNSRRWKTFTHVRHDPR